MLRQGSADLSHALAFTRSRCTVRSGAASATSADCPVNLETLWAVALIVTGTVTLVS